MNVGDLKALLAQYPDDTELLVELERGATADPSMRDLVDNRTMTCEATFLHIRSRYSGGKVGLPHLTEDERKRQRLAILDGLNSGQCFTSVHGDYRIYAGHTDDASCYGTAYDPRVFSELANEGLLWLRQQPGIYRFDYRITKEGQIALAAMKGQALVVLK